MRRKIYIQNESGHRIALNGETGITIIDATGFGVDTAEEFSDIGFGFFSATRTGSHPQQSIAGTLIFKGADTFSMYQNFAAFVLTAQKLFVVAELVSGGAFLREIRVNFITKGERRLSYLEVPVSFLTVTPWFKNTKLNIRLDRAPEFVTRFGAAVFGQSTFTAAFDSGFTAEIPPAGHLPAVLRLTFTGVVSNPIIELRGEGTGTLYCLCAVSVKLNAGDRLEYSASPVDAYIRKVSSAGTVIDLMDQLDPSADPFALIPNTEAVRLTLRGDEEPDGTAEAFVRYYYRSI